MQIGSRSVSEFRAGPSRGAGFIHVGQTSRYSSALDSRTRLSPPAIAKSGGWLSALFVGYGQADVVRDQLEERGFVGSRQFETVR